jgi:carbonic anhydrase
MKAYMSSQRRPSQSPIDLGCSNPLEIQLPADEVVLSWDDCGVGTSRPGAHGPEIEFENSKAKISVRIPGRNDPTEFTLAKFHFHSRSEHRVNGKDWPLEVHIVHKTTEPDLWNPGADREIYAVLAVMIEAGDADGKVNEFFHQMLLGLETRNSRTFARRSEQEKGQKSDEPLDPHLLLPFDAPTSLESIPYWRYEGSLTSEILEPNDGYVSWIVLKDVKKIDGKLLGEWLKLKHEAKHPQDIDRRFVLFSSGKKT